MNRHEFATGQQRFRDRILRAIDEFRGEMPDNLSATDVLDLVRELVADMEAETIDAPRCFGGGIDG